MDTKNIKDMLGSALGMVILFILLGIVISLMKEDVIKDECGPGYHQESYTTSYGETVDNCYRD